MMELKFPWMRAELIEYLESLSNKEYQMECWVKHNCPPGVEDFFGLSVHFLYDDTRLAKDSLSYIDVVLMDKQEAVAIKQLTNGLDAVLEKPGFEETDEEYINLPEWDDVLKSAAYALELLKKNDSMKIESIIDQFKAIEPNSEGLDLILHGLKKEGCSKVESISALMEIAGMGLVEAKSIVHYSKAWSDVKDRDEKIHDQIADQLK